MAPEDRSKERGFNLIAGVDEAGRGPLAGPVVAAAVILDDRFEYPGVGDSKTMTENQRESAFWLILRQAKTVSYGLADQTEIDRFNILQATLKAMMQAVSGLDPSPDYLLIDGIVPLPLDMPQRALPHGDSLSLSIGAASIVAKVVRDRLMVGYDRLYPAYGFASHKGYATRRHLDALAKCGPCPLHRLTFARVRTGPET
ncbi:MAG: ribonuclease HII [Deltaproteobacteria bacterium]|nr:ribonuclease HII [Deltaproteobacteria bacterium]MBW2052715.1 ribonuclease HII [Deltaproteobacteria bacterium]MBW2141209.1 ribonuclease HII [Deltaproteobacteria bacterium]MBW2323071.1 ribonuclease HII [Deltaproteobacteria bacterium]